MTDPRIVGNQVTLHKVGETATGIVVRGARILATLAPFADEIAVYPGLPIPADATAYALAFAIPVDTPGLIFLCRDSASAPGAHPFDRPLSSRFDEQDAFVIFDDVEVPRERVFLDGRVDIYNGIRETGIVENLTNQTTIRALTKLEFAYGLATRMAEAINDQSPATQEMLGELLSYVEVTRSAVLLSAEHGRHVGDGVWFPDPRPLVPMRSLLADVVPAGRRDHHAHRQPQPAGHAEPPAARRRRRCARCSTSSSTAPTGSTRRRGRPCSGSRGTSWAPGSPAGICSTSASTSPRRAATASPRTRPTPTAAGRTRSSTASSPPAATAHHGRSSTRAMTRRDARARCGRRQVALFATVCCLVVFPAARSRFRRRAERSGPGAAAPAGVVREVEAGLARAVQRFEARDVAGVLAQVSEQYRTGPITKAAIREQLLATYGLYDSVKATVRIDEVRMVGEHAWVYSTGEVSGRLRLLGTPMVFLSWERELEVVRREGGAWRLFGYQQ